MVALQPVLDLFVHLHRVLGPLFPLLMLYLWGPNMITGAPYLDVEYTASKIIQNQLKFSFHVCSKNGTINKNHNLKTI